MKGLLVAALLFVSLCAFSSDFVSPRSRIGTLGVDIGFLLLPEQLKLLHQERRGLTPYSRNLDEIIRIGARALDWVDLVQRDVPVKDREQIWRRADRVGREATPEKPMYYNEQIIVSAFEKIMQEAPTVVAQVLQSTQPLPAQIPMGMGMSDFMKTMRQVHVLYSRTSRWLVLSEYRHLLTQGPRDFRGWLMVRAQKDALFEQVSRWAALNQDVRSRFVSLVAQACPLTRRSSVNNCMNYYGSSIRNPNAGTVLKSWLEEVLIVGGRAYTAKFGVQVPHIGVSKHNHGNFKEIVLPTYRIEADIFSWIRDRLKEAWFWKDAVGVDMEFNSGNVPGAVTVVWQKGALPNVNTIGGDIITMDDNIPRWLEVTQIVMRHELGHVLGFPDCYTEFYDTSLNAFTYYVLDADDGMCALSGLMRERHRDALLKGYF